MASALSTGVEQEMTADQGWLDRMIEQEPQAAEQWTGGDEFEPSGDKRDANQLYTDLLAEPDESADPYRQTDAGGTA
jgi:hypothetical protein